MKEKLYDLFTCFKLSLKIFIPIFLFGALIGLVIGITKGQPIMYNVLTWGFYIGTWISSLGLFVCAIAFVKPTFLSDLNHQKKWRVYFYKMNLFGVMLSICLFMYAYLATIDVIRYYFFQ